MVSPISQTYLEQDSNFDCLGLNSKSQEGQIAMKRIELESVPVVIIFKLNKEANTSEIKFMLDGENLSNDQGKEYRLFLRQAIDALQKELQEEMLPHQIEEEKSGEFLDLSGNEEEEEVKSVPLRQQPQIRGVQLPQQEVDEDMLMAQRLQEELYQEEVREREKRQTDSELMAGFFGYT